MVGQYSTTNSVLGPSLFPVVGPFILVVPSSPCPSRRRCLTPVLYTSGQFIKPQRTMRERVKTTIFMFKSQYQTFLTPLVPRVLVQV